MLRLEFDQTPFIGRESERARLTELLLSRRFVTITGPGGTGKTRLAVQVANDLTAQWPGGVRFIDLAVVEDPSSVPSSFEEEGSQWASLLVVDNCEHVSEAAAAAIKHALEADDRVKVLATSRQPLKLRSQSVFPLAPLEVPPQNASVEQLLASDAVRLFRDRALMADPTFEVNASNVGDIVAICRECDGLPLAIELVAPYVRSLATPELLERIQKGGVHSMGSGHQDDRQSTIAGAIHWSYRLLDDEEKAVLSALSVFTGRFTLDAAKHVVDAIGIDAQRATDVIVSLVDRSLVRPHRKRDGTWYGLLETVKAFAWEHLAAFDDPDNATLVFEREGDLWRIGWSGETFLLRDSKGLRYIRTLLDKPGVEVPSLALVAPGVGGSSPIEAIDPQAKAAYKRRLEDLEEQIADAESLGDSMRVSRAREERAALAAELARTVGLGGRIRSEGSDAERARMSVTKAIRAAIEKIREQDSDVADLLDRSIQTGTYCVYSGEGA